VGATCFTGTLVAAMQRSAAAIEAFFYRTRSETSLAMEAWRLMVHGEHKALLFCNTCGETVRCMRFVVVIVRLRCAVCC